MAGLALSILGKGEASASPEPSDEFDMLDAPSSDLLEAIESKDKTKLKEAMKAFRAAIKASE